MYVLKTKAAWPAEPPRRFVMGIGPSQGRSGRRLGPTPFVSSSEGALESGSSMRYDSPSQRPRSIRRQRSLQNGRYGRSAARAVHFLSGASENECNSSKLWPHASQLYSYVGIVHLSDY